MKIKEGFMLRQVAESWVVVPMSNEELDFNGMITLNETGAFLWKRLGKDCTREELIKALMEEYEVTEARASVGVDKFLELIEENQFAEN